MARMQNKLNGGWGGKRFANLRQQFSICHTYWLLLWASHAKKIRFLLLLNIKSFVNIFTQEQRMEGEEIYEFYFASLTNMFQFSSICIIWYVFNSLCATTTAMLFFTKGHVGTIWIFLQFEKLFHFVCVSFVSFNPFIHSVLLFWIRMLPWRRLNNDPKGMSHATPSQNILFSFVIDTWGASLFFLQYNCRRNRSLFNLNMYVSLSL